MTTRYILENIWALIEAINFKLYIFFNLALRAYIKWS